MSSDVHDDSNATRSASPSTAEQTRTHDALPAAGPHERPSAAAQLRDPDRYQIIGEHGRGGLGRVSRAHDRDLGRDVAIKELISRGNLSEVRFLREALITARLEHPGIVPVHEAGRWPDGTPFYAMKLVAGRPLRDLIAERTTVAERIGLLHHVIAVADAIAYAHGRNIIHRDLKPANVIVGDFGETIVIDWGLAKDLSTTEESTIGGGPFRANRDNDLTAAGTVLGTPAYMAPEQERGEHVDQRADVFAIGAMLWELCSLQKVPPTDPRLRHRMLRRAGIDQDLVTIIDKTLDPAPRRRYPDAGALAADLKAFKSGARIAARTYSLFALLAHWIRRHRILGLSLVLGAVLAAAGVTLYVTNIASERTRTDEARMAADKQRDVAAAERDRAQLSEASLLLEKDPTRAKRQISHVTNHSAAYAILASRAEQQSATHAIRIPGNVSRLLYDPASSALALAMTNGILASVDPATDSIEVIANDITGPTTISSGHWIYARRPAGSVDVLIAGASSLFHTRNVGPLLSDITAQLVTSGSKLYGLDSTNLYIFDESGPRLLVRDIRSIAGNSRILMTCSTANVLNVSLDGMAQPQTPCATNISRSPMIAAEGSYTALMTQDALLLVRSGKRIELRTHIAGEYALALAPSGLLALADFEGKSWFVRPGSEQLEPGPRHASQPTAAAADGFYAAWGYLDGSVVVLDTSSNTTWEFKGHAAIVGSITVDAKHTRVVTVAGLELRIWSIAPSPLHKVADMPCKVFNVAYSEDLTRAAMDCADGTLRIWSTDTNMIHNAHHHGATAFGVAWLRERACSSSFDGSVICTNPTGSAQRILDSPQSVRWITSSPDRKALAMATAEGKIRLFDGRLRTLYSHNACPYRMAFSADGRLFASGAIDGSVIIYDFDHSQIVAALNTHADAVTSVEWQAHELWTSSADGTIRHWVSQAGTYLAHETERGTGTFRFFHLLDNGWVCSTDEQFLLLNLYSGTAQYKLKIDLGRRIERIELSSNRRYVAATVAHEVIVFDLLLNVVTSFYIPGDGIGYVGFPTSNTIMVSGSDGLMSASLSGLQYQQFNPAH